MTTGTTTTYTPTWFGSWAHANAHVRVHVGGTRGLKNLLANVCRRLTGAGGEVAAIFRLDTSRRRRQDPRVDCVGSCGERVGDRHLPQNSVRPDLVAQILRNVGY